MDYLTAHGFNKMVNNKNREEALAARGEDCSSYMDAARQLELERKRLFLQAAPLMQQQNRDLFNMGTQLKKQGQPYTLK